MRPSVYTVITFCTFVLWVGTVGAAWWTAAHVASRLDCVSQKDALLVTTASGHKLCVSGKGMVWL